MSLIRRFALTWLAAFAIAACGETLEPDDSGEGGDSSDTDSDSDSDPDPDSDVDIDADADSDTDDYWDTETGSKHVPTLDEICEQAPILGPEAAQVIAASNTFGANLMRQVSQHMGDDNITLSPVSLHTVWSMLYNGTAGATADEVHDTLALEALDADSLNDGYLETLLALRQQDPTVTLDMANSMWIRDWFAGDVLPEYISMAETYYLAPVEIMDFSLPTAADTINQWVYDNTGGNIDDLIADPIGQLVVMYLVNAVYFESPWTYRFDPADTSTSTFLTSAGDESEVEMMYTHACLPYYQNGEIDMVQLPYGNGIYAMSLILPAGDADIAEVVDSFGWSDWHEWQSGAYIAEVDLWLPRFEVAFDSNMEGVEGTLVDVMKELGIHSAFGQEGYPVPDLSQLASPSGGLFVSNTRQKTFVQVTEAGTEAASASMVEISIVIDGDSDMPPEREIRFDRPFLFAIHDRCNGSIIFLGQITDPPLVAG